MKASLAVKKQMNQLDRIERMLRSICKVIRIDPETGVEIEVPDVQRPEPIEPEVTPEPEPEAPAAPETPAAPAAEAPETPAEE